jgi:hypothetical protein
MASGGVSGAFGTTTSTSGWGTKLVGAGDVSGDAYSGSGTQTTPTVNGGNITINVTVPPATDPKHVKATTKAVVDAVNKTKTSSASRKS